MSLENVQYHLVPNYDHIRGYVGIFTPEMFTMSKLVMGAYIGNECVGFSAQVESKQRKGYLYTSYKYVKPAYNNNGIGTQLSQQIVQRAQENYLGTTGYIYDVFQYSQGSSSLTDVEEYDKNGIKSLRSALSAPSFPYTVYFTQREGHDEIVNFHLLGARHFTDHRFEYPHIDTHDVKKVKSFLYEELMKVRMRE